MKDICFAFKKDFFRLEALRKISIICETENYAIEKFSQFANANAKNRIEEELDFIDFHTDEIKIFVQLTIKPLVVNHPFSSLNVLYSTNSYFA